MKMLFSCRTGDQIPKGVQNLFGSTVYFRQTAVLHGSVQGGSVPLLTALTAQIKAPSESSGWGFFLL